MIIRKSDERRHKIQAEVYRTSLNLELIMAGIVIVGILIAFLDIPIYLSDLFHDATDFNSFLKYLFNIIIGIELLKMLCRHDIDSVVEVLLFAVARGMVIEHMTIYETLVGVAAIAMLFVIRKFLFVSALDKKDEETANAAGIIHAEGRPDDCNHNDVRYDDKWDPEESKESK